MDILARDPVARFSNVQKFARTTEIIQPTRGAEHYRTENRGAASGHPVKATVVWLERK